MPRKIGRKRRGANAETQTQNPASCVDISAYKVSTYDGKSIYILLIVQKSLYAQSEAMFFRRAQTPLRQLTRWMQLLYANRFVAMKTPRLSV